MRTVHAVLGASLALAGSVAAAATISVVGLFPSKAVVSIDGAAPKSVSIGETVGGFKLVSVDSNGATFLLDGRRQSIPMGSYLAARQSGNSRAAAVLPPDSRGHFIADGLVNGVGMRFLVDTGASLVVMSAADARRLNLPVTDAPMARATTANGVVAYRTVKLDRVRIGDLEMTNIDAGVLENYDGPALLGMSFLSRTEVSRDGANMVLTRRY